MARKAEASGSFFRFVAVTAVLIGVEALAQAPAETKVYASPYLLATLSDQPHVARVGHDHFVPDLTQQTAHTWRVHSRLQRDATARHSPEHLTQSLGSRAHPLLQQHPATFIKYAVPAAAIPQVQPDG